MHIEGCELATAVAAGGGFGEMHYGIPHFHVMDIWVEQVHLQETRSVLGSVCIFRIRTVLALSKKARI